MLEHLALGELARIAGWLGLAGIIVVGSLVAAYALPGVRRLALEVAAVAATAGFLYGYGVHDEHLLCAAQQRQAEQASHARDARQTDLAAQDEQTSATELKSDSLKDQEQVDALRKSDASCHPITADELR